MKFLTGTTSCFRVFPENENVASHRLVVSDSFFATVSASREFSDNAAAEAKANGEIETDESATDTLLSSRERSTPVRVYYRRLRYTCRVGDVGGSEVATESTLGWRLARVR